MKKSRKVKGIAIIVLIIIALSISFENRVIYGTWNAFSYPNRVSYDGYCYFNDGYIVMLTGDEEPQYEVSRNIDRLTGKRIYSKKKDDIGIGKAVYLHLDGDRYLVLVCGGGA